MAHRRRSSNISGRCWSIWPITAALSKRHLELALVAVSLLNKCDYCVSHHAPKLAMQGVSEQGAERLLDYAIIRNSTPSTSSLSNIPSP